MNRTYSRHGALPLAAVLVAGLATVVLPSAPEAQGLGHRADVTVFSGGVDFRPNVPYSRAVITVSGNGTVFRHALEDGEGLSIGMFDPEGKPLADGVYSWQLQLVPDAATARELRLAASLNGGEAPEPWSAQSGTFTIQNGSIATPDFVEPKPVQPAGSQLTSSLPMSLGAQGSLGFSRAAAEDDDGSVLSGRAVEGQSRSAAQAVTAFRTVFQQPTRMGLERSDATALAAGQSLEPPLSPKNSQPGSSQNALTGRQTKPRDGANGRPAEDQ